MQESLLTRAATLWIFSCKQEPVRFDRCSLCVVLYVVFQGFSLGQQAPSTTSPAQPEDKRIFWIVPNYRTSPGLRPYKPLTAEEKFKIAMNDAFDRGTVGLAVLFGARLN